MIPKGTHVIQGCPQGAKPSFVGCPQGGETCFLWVPQGGKTDPKNDPKRVKLAQSVMSCFRWSLATPTPSHIPPPPPNPTKLPPPNPTPLSPYPTLSHHLYPPHPTTATHPIPPPPPTPSCRPSPPHSRPTSPREMQASPPDLPVRDVPDPNDEDFGIEADEGQMVWCQVGWAVAGPYATHYLLLLLVTAGKQRLGAGHDIGEEEVCHLVFRRRA